MTSYLQRLADRTAPAVQRQLDPFVHSRSPIAEHDQRLGLPGFEAAGTATEVTPRFSSALPRPWITTGSDSPSLQRLVQPAPGAAGSAQTTPSHSTNAASSSTPASSELGSEANKRPAERSRPSRVVAGKHSQDAHRARSASGTELVSAPPSRLFAGFPVSTSSRDASGTFGASSGNAPTTRGLGDDALRSDFGSRTVPRSARASEEAVALGSDEIGGAHPASTETPRYLTPAFPPPSVASGHSFAVDMPPVFDTETTPPRLEIGSIQVEVLPPPTPQETTTTTRGPVTAESASVIGPLAARRRSNLRFGLRQR